MPQGLYLQFTELNCLLLLFQELDYSEFKMFAMACIDRQSEIESAKENKSNVIFNTAGRIFRSCAIM